MTSSAFLWHLSLFPVPFGSVMGRSGCHPGVITRWCGRRVTVQSGWSFHFPHVDLEPGGTRREQCPPTSPAPQKPLMETEAQCNSSGMYQADGNRSWRFRGTQFSDLAP